MESAIEQIGGFSCTTDLWSDNYRKINYISLTAHMNLPNEDNSFDNKNIILAVESIEDTSGVTIRKSINEILQRFNVFNIEKCVIFVSDRGSNVNAALEGYTHIHCIAHIINNIVESMCKPQCVKEVISEVCGFVRYMKKSGLNIDCTMSLKSMVETRWNTVHDMLHSVIIHYDDLATILLQKKKKLKKLQKSTKI